MSTYISTRGASRTSFREALFTGLAPDGGLYLPERSLRLGSPPNETRGSFLAHALWAAEALIPGLSSEIRRAVLTEALTFPIPLIELEPNLHILELFHGPTHAFKDVGARFMAQAMRILGGRSESHTILAATSGDTGGAVADAFYGLDGYTVALLFPRDGISERQRRQMTTLGANVLALSVDGTFDDCQRLVKAAFMDEALTARFGLTSANSINVGRLLPQSFYYTYAASELGWDGSPTRFVVPCGNLGNLCAGLMAHRSGMPAEHFVAATNANKMFVEFLETEQLLPRPSVPTCSNAMDVGDPSNLERILWLYRRQPEQLRRDVTGTSVDDSQTTACLSDVYQRTGYILDPHTAVAYVAARSKLRESPGPTVILATAHPAKFPEVVRKATGRALQLPEGLASKLRGEEHITPIDPDLASLVSALHQRAP